MFRWRDTPKEFGIWVWLKRLLSIPKTLSSIFRRQIFSHICIQINIWGRNANKLERMPVTALSAEAQAEVKAKKAAIEVALPADVAGNIPLTEFSAPLAPPPLFRSNFAIRIYWFVAFVCSFVYPIIIILSFGWLFVCLFVVACNRDTISKKHFTCFTNNPITCLTLIHTLV